MLAYTIEQQGQSLKLDCSDNRTIMTDDWDDALGFLLYPTDFGVVFNLDAFVDDLISIMPKSLATKIKQGGRVYTPTNRKLYYQPNRMLGVNYVNIYGLNRYTNEPITDCAELLELGERVVDAYHEIGIEDVTRLTSPVALYGQVLDNIPFPRACDLPDSAFTLLEACTPIQTREWRQVYQLGHWEADEISDYDIISAYPSLLAQLPDIRHARFFSSNTMPEHYSWGVLTGQLKINKPASPFICQEQGVYGIGEWPDVITTEQLKLLKRYDIGDFIIESGEFFTLPPSFGYPFRDTMQKLYDTRLSSNELVSKIVKGISVGIGGKLAEIYSNGDLGENFNSIYALMMTSRCMVTVASFIYRNGLDSSTISVLVDGFLATKRLPVINKNVMGSWKINDPLPALVASLEYQWQGNKRPNYMTYDEMMGLIRENPKLSNYGGIDLNLLAHNRNFPKLPHTGQELISRKYGSLPYEIEG